MTLHDTLHSTKLQQHIMKKQRQAETEEQAALAREKQRLEMKKELKSYVKS